MLEESAYVYWLKCVPGLGNRAIQRILELPGGAKTAFEADEKILRAMQLGIESEKIERLLAHRKKENPERLWEDLQKKEIKLTWSGAEDYPKRLKQIPDPPNVLFYKGRLQREDQKHIAVVGARDCTEYGIYMAKTIGKALGAAKCVVVSGMARGIDGISQKAALQQHGGSVGVLGCGVDICYPKQNGELYENLVEQGCIVSEYLPGTQPTARLFPARNRIISGLSDTLVVIEAREKSGTFITVDMALEQGREVYAVPGRLTDPLSVGCNKLIHQGAGVYTGVSDLLGQWDGKNDLICMTSEQPAHLFTEQEKRIYDVLDIIPMNVDEIWIRLKEEMELQEIMWGLLQLCVKGFARQVSANSYVRIL